MPGVIEDEDFGGHGIGSPALIGAILTDVGIPVVRAVRRAVIRKTAVRVMDDRRGCVFDSSCRAGCRACSSAPARRGKPRASASAATPSTCPMAASRCWRSAPPAAVEELRRWLQRGPPAARVDAVECREVGCRAAFQPASGRPSSLVEPGALLLKPAGAQPVEHFLRDSRAGRRCRCSAPAPSSSRLFPCRSSSAGWCSP